MLVTEIIRTKRDGGTLSEAQIEAFVAGLADESIPAEQVAALAMAILLNGMSFDETASLTNAMAASGTMLDWTDLDLDGPVVDKHSTGGVGDKVSFMLAPIVAACGCYVPMISGRGLGHTGGTTDKAESIPGYDTAPDFATFRRVVAEVGCAIIGQTGDLAPADRRFYAIRDITGTVESIPLITASILSKKLAAGLGALVMDVKTGSGAFMQSLDRARELADSIIRTAGRAGVRAHALITDMNHVLGTTAGNALEIREAIAYLRDEAREPRLDEVVLGLGAEMLVATEVEQDRNAARQRCADAVSSGAAAEVFGRMCAALGGPADLLDRPEDYLATAPVVRPVHAQGCLAAVDTRAVGNAIIELGGGRRRVGEALDHAVGFSEFASLGTELGDDVPLALVHAASDDAARAAGEALLAAVRLQDAAVESGPAVIEILPGAD
ncbi:MAG: thymidine phosphorylase [Woeseiaceae bacterium]|nr:thymidine phosphorylase [Woeseiaceae bacterium]